MDHIIAINERHLKRLISEYSTTITWTARISALRREHRSEELAQCLPVALFLANDLVGCIIATIGLPDSDGLILKPAPELDPDIYVGTTHGQS